jgi:hypothetical protein
MANQRNPPTNNQVSSQDPTACRTHPLFTQKPGLCSTQPHPQHSKGVEITRRKTHDARREPASPYGEAP